mgnify:CR=1 FL=1
MNKLRVLVVDDSLVYRNIVSKAVKNTGIARVDCTASGGVTALERLEQREIDVVLLDVFMPEMDGIETLKEIKKRYSHLPVIMISGGGEDGARLTVKALEQGTMDFILKPQDGDPHKNITTISRHLGILFSQIVMDKYLSGKPVAKKTIKKANVKVDKQIAGPKREKEGEKEKEEKPDKLTILDSTCITGVDLVVVASSTGGPNAVEEVCRSLGSNFTKPILLVQHMPADFTRIFSDFLNKKTNIKVKEAEQGDQVVGGQVLVAPGGYHMTVDPPDRRGGALRVSLNTDDPVNGVRPAADVLFRSVAQNYKGKRILAIILTGMGNDGTQGIRELKEACQCYCITQSQETCVIYGMPRSVYEMGLSDEVVHLQDIGRRIIEISRGRC